MNGKKWTDAEREIIRRHYRTSGAKYCAALTGRPYKAVQQQAAKMFVKSLRSLEAGSQYSTLYSRGQLDALDRIGAAYCAGAITFAEASHRRALVVEKRLDEAVRYLAHIKQKRVQ